MSDSIVFNCRPTYSRFREKCYNQSAVDKNGRHGNKNTCCVGLMSIYSKFIGENTLFGALKTTLNNDLMSSIDILFNTQRPGSV